MALNQCLVSPTSAAAPFWQQLTLTETSASLLTPVQYQTGTEAIPQDITGQVQSMKNLLEYFQEL